MAEKQESMYTIDGDQIGVELRSPMSGLSLDFAHLENNIMQQAFNVFPKRLLSAGWVRTAVAELHTKITQGTLKNTDARTPTQRLIPNL